MNMETRHAKSTTRRIPLLLPTESTHANRGLIAHDHAHIIVYEAHLCQIYNSAYANTRFLMSSWHSPSLKHHEITRLEMFRAVNGRATLPLKLQMFKFKGVHDWIPYKPKIHEHHSVNIAIGDSRSFGTRRRRDRVRPTAGRWVCWLQKPLGPPTNHCYSKSIKLHSQALEEWVTGNLVRSP